MCPVVSNSSMRVRNYLPALPVCQGFAPVHVPLTVQGVESGPPEDQGVIGQILTLEHLSASSSQLQAR